MNLHQEKMREIFLAYVDDLVLSFDNIFELVGWT